MEMRASQISAQEIKVSEAARLRALSPLANCLSPVRATSELNQNLQVQERFGSVRIQRAELLRHKPGRRCLIRYTGTSATGLPVNLLGKIRFKGLDCRTIEVTRRLWQDGWDDQCSSYVPRSLGAIPRWKMTLQEEVQGQVLLEEPDWVSRQRQVALGLARFHKSEAGVGRHYSIDDEMAMLQTRLNEVKEQRPAWKRQVDRVLQGAERRAKELQHSRLKTVHRDFYFDQVLVTSDGRLAFLDLDLVCMGPAALDVGNYLAHWIEYGLRHSEWSLASLAVRRAFQKAYLEANPAVSNREVQNWTWLSLARHVSLSTRLVGRSHTTLPLFQMLTHGGSDE